MARVTIYCVQPFWRSGQKLAHGELQEFGRERDARRAAERAGRREAGAIVYAVDGCPVFDVWSRPRLIAKHGDVPAIEF
jgi:hypothetical protein